MNPLVPFSENTISTVDVRTFSDMMEMAERRRLEKMFSGTQREHLERLCTEMEGMRYSWSNIEQNLFRRDLQTYLGRKVTI